ncbi:hypothetical protein AAFF_G00290860 [Aldrovandia affinis]|uniref:Uncharacterized protein n=1 Tax=Aldrovandia affinis TaxID=143900 RepID=A0AAD7RA24_9TELE|nr:hypothetical protein AAFF_G00290860 [Aldrovandia affinis]
MSFMIDGDTDISTKECVIVYSRILRKGRPVNILIGHIEVEHAHAQEVMATRPKPGGRLSQFIADLRLQRRQQDEQSDMPLYKFQNILHLVHILLVLPVSSAV